MNDRIQKPMNISIAVVDDKESFRKKLVVFLQKTNDNEGIKSTVYQYSSGMEFLENNNQVFDLVFMDIDMPLMSGLETAKNFRKTNPKTCLIFITNMMQYAINGYEVDALDFMVKPVVYNNFVSKLKKAYKYISKYKKVLLTIKLNSEIVRIDLNSILYVEVMRNTIFYHTENKVFEERNTLTSVTKKLQEYNFVLCNSCYLINLQYVDKITTDSVFIGDKELRISRNKKKTFMELLNIYIGDGGI